MAFWYVKTPLRPGSVFGHEDKFSGLGIFLDTYANQNGESALEFSRTIYSMIFLLFFFIVSPSRN